MKRAALILAMTPVLAGPATGAFADALATPTTTSPTTTSPTTTTTTVTTPPPPASATGTALDVAGVVTIGKTSATAGPTSQTASATALALGGTTVAGGDAQTGKKTSGNIFDSGSTPLGSLAIAPWSADASQAGQSTSDAALLRLTVVNSNTLAVNVLQSHSHAQYAGSGSQGSASSDGATLMLGGGALFIDLLHAESTSGQAGSSYLIGINGNTIGSSGQVNGQCVIDVPGLLHLICLAASGGAGSVESTGTVAQAELGGGALPTGTISSVEGSGAPAAAPASKPTVGSGEKKPTRVLGERFPQSGNASGLGLPFTGFPLAVFLALAGALAATGAGLRRVARLGRAVA